MEIIDIGSSIMVDKSELPLIKEVVDKGHKISLQRGLYTNYPSSWGQIELRKAIVSVFKKKAGVKLDPNKETMITQGIIKAVDTTLQSLVISHVAIPSLSPYYIRSLAILRKKKIIEIPFDPYSGELKLSVIENKINKLNKKILFIISHPNSPTGRVFKNSFISNNLIPFVKKHGYLFSDSYVLATSFNNSKEIKPIISYEGAKEVTVEAITLSKELGLPGIRIGGIVGNKEIINALRLYASCSLDMVPGPNQQIAAIALNEIPFGVSAERIKEELANEIIPSLLKLEWSFIKPDAGYDMLLEVPPKCRSLAKRINIDPSLLTSMSIAIEYGVAFCPTNNFGKQGSNYVRIVLKQEKGTIPHALELLLEKGFNWNIYKPKKRTINSFLKTTEDLDITYL